MIALSHQNSPLSREVHDSLSQLKDLKRRVALAESYLGAQFRGGEEVRRLCQPVSDQCVHQWPQRKTAFAARLGVNQTEGLP